MDKNNTKSPFLTSYQFSKALLNNFEVGYVESGEESLKGSISDIFVWDYSLSADDITNYMTCDKTETWNTAMMQWSNLTKYWSIIQNQGHDGGLRKEKKNRSNLCRSYDYQYYVGFSQVRSFKNAIKHCSSFGGELPLPGR